MPHFPGFSKTARSSFVLDVLVLIAIGKKRQIRKRRGFQAMCYATLQTAFRIVCFYFKLCILMIMSFKLYVLWLRFYKWLAFTFEILCFAVVFDKVIRRIPSLHYTHITTLIIKNIIIHNWSSTFFWTWWTSPTFVLSWNSPNQTSPNFSELWIVA